MVPHSHMGRRARLHPLPAAGGQEGAQGPLKACKTPGEWVQPTPERQPPRQDKRGSSFDMALFSDRPSASHTSLSGLLAPGGDGGDTRSAAARAHRRRRANTGARVLPPRVGRAGWALSKQSLGEDRPPSRAEKGGQAGEPVAPRPAAPWACRARGAWEAGAWRRQEPPEVETQPPGARPPQQVASWLLRAGWGHAEGARPPAPPHCP